MQGVQTMQAMQGYGMQGMRVQCKATVAYVRHACATHVCAMQGMHVRFVLAGGLRNSITWGQVRPPWRHDVKVVEPRHGAHQSVAASAAALGAALGSARSPGRLRWSQRAIRGASNKN